MYPPAELARGEHLDPERLVFAGNAGNTGNYGGLPGGEGWQRVQRLLDQGEWDRAARSPSPSLDRRGRKALGTKTGARSG